ncbi:hypothetical protein HGA91_01820 [candidate division WWE3 bacterium]|nr:hypothetical protein [candidate division WWE3 bacterium]
MNQEAVKQAQLQEIYSLFGLVLFLSQSIERNLAMLLSLLDDTTPTTNQPDTYDEVVDDLSQQTLGNLIFKFRYQTSDTRFVKRLFNVLNQRNHLTHHYFWQHAGLLNTNRGRTKIVHELTQCRDEFQAVNNEINMKIRQNALLLGVTDQIIEEEIIRMTNDIEE